MLPPPFKVHHRKAIRWPWQNILSVLHALFFHHVREHRLFATTLSCTTQTRNPQHLSISQHATLSRLTPEQFCAEHTTGCSIAAGQPTPATNIVISDTYVSAGRWTCLPSTRCHGVVGILSGCGRSWRTAKAWHAHIRLPGNENGDVERKRSTAFESPAADANKTGLSPRFSGSEEAAAHQGTTISGPNQPHQPTG
jgi:hypothetical protein